MVNEFHTVNTIAIHHLQLTENQNKSRVKISLSKKKKKKKKRIGIVSSFAQWHTRWTIAIFDRSSLTIRSFFPSLPRAWLEKDWDDEIDTGNIRICHNCRPTIPRLEKDAEPKLRFETYEVIEENYSVTKPVNCGVQFRISRGPLFYLTSLLRDRTFGVE
jgi:hypothetical protein